ncbi:HesA/MoeB/ThiF family protein [Cereibacter sp. SYSU M97828]|nr:HesA/MoeB/ThiF family protein [Cereibacter flavus]
MVAGDAMRYARQEVMIGAEGQARLRAARVLVVGAGGLGVPVLQYLVAAGVGRIVLVDPDRVEVSNLHRQPIYGRHLGMPKVHAAALEMAALNPDVVVEGLAERLDPSNAAALVAKADVVLDCADSFAATYVLSDACFAAGRALISASVLRAEGFVGGFCGGAPSVRAVFPELPERAGSCASSGVMGPMVGMIGAAQAQMAMTVLLGDHAPLGSILRFDGLRPSGFRFDGAAEQEGFRFIALKDVCKDDLAVELREEAERPFVPWAVREACPDGRRVVFACRSGLRAWAAADRLRRRWPGEIVLVAMG